MYRLDWIEQLKLRTTTLPAAGQVRRVSPTVWKLGFTSLLTDISAEMVNSMLPLYVVLHLHLSPLQYGAIDGIYHGVAVALLGLAGGLVADRARRHKEVAFAGYGLSALCKLGLLGVGGAWVWIAAVTAIDRTGKGARTAPRDALISLHSARESLASAFAVHRALDAAGSLLGPLVAFALIARLPGAYDAVWVTSFVFALLGLAVLWLFVENPRVAIPVRGPASFRAALGLFGDVRFRGLALAGGALAAATVSDGFLYLLLQQRAGTPSSFFPLFYVVTSTCYMILSIPVGRVADAWGRTRVLLGGYGVLAVLYVGLLSLSGVTLAMQLGCLLLLGLYYAATEGVLMAMASAVIPAELRTSGLAVLTTVIGLAKMVSSVGFGWLWHSRGHGAAVAVFLGLLAAALAASLFWLRGSNHNEQAA